MKMTGWKGIILQLLLGGVMIAYGMTESDSNGGVYILLAIIMWIRMVLDAVSGEKHEEDMLCSYAKRWHCRRRFGRFGLVVPWLGLLLLILDGMLILVLPPVSVAGVLVELIFGAALLSIVLYVIWQKLQMRGMDDKEEAQIEADYATYERHKRQLKEADRRRWGIFAPIIPLLGAIPLAAGLLLNISPVAKQMESISSILICIGIICILLQSWWQDWRIEYWEETGKDQSLSDDPEQHL